VRLSREDWVTAGLTALGSGGPGAVMVEPIAASLQATKGSFYWHFRDRAELLTAALERWEQLATQSVIEHLEPIADPRMRLRALLSIAFRDEDELRLEGVVLASGHDPVVAEFVERVTATRTAFLSRVFVDLGLPSGEAKVRGRIAYATYVGHVQLGLTDSGDQPSRASIKRVIDEMISIFAPDGAAARRKR
jgi:AcrR family transcriptional regulator